MDITWALLLVPPFILPFIKRKWSLLLTYLVFGFISVFSLINIWVLLTNWSHMSEGLSWLFGMVITLCLAMILLARHWYAKSLRR